MQENKIKNLRAEIEQMLKDNPLTRNDDQLLTLKLWVKLFPELIFKSPDDKQAVRLKDVLSLPREDNVKRLRAKIQNEDLMYLPTDPNVRKKRQISEDVWRNYCRLN